MKPKHISAALLLVLTTIVTAFGWFDRSSHETIEIINQYGDRIATYGSGVYAADSAFKAPIFRGSDLTMLVLVCPALLIAIWSDYRNKSARSHLFLTSVVSCITYYSTSVAFGVQYNQFHLVYIALFGLSVITTAHLFSLQNFSNEKVKLPRSGVNIFLVVVGIILCVAWMPDILSALFAKRGPSLIEHYTTEITYVLDIGLMTPCAFLAAYYLKKEKPIGMTLLDTFLTLSLLMSVMLPVQTAVQEAAGIHLPIPVLVTKVGTFVVLGLFAVYFKFRIYKVIPSVSLTNAG